MKFITTRKHFLDVLQLVNGVVGRGQAMPILANALVNVQNSSVSFTGTDLDVELTVRMQLEQAAEEGATTIPGRKLLDIAKALSDESDITLTQEEKKILIQSGCSRFSLQSLPADDFPSIECGPNNIEFTIKQNELRYLLESVYFSMAEQDVRYYLNGLLLEITPEYFRTVAADGHRLSMCTFVTETELEQHQCLILRKGVLGLLRLLTDSEDPITIAIGDNFIKVFGDNYVFVSKLIEGRYPNYHSVIPRDGDKIITLGRDGFRQLLTRTSVLVNEQYQATCLSLRSDKLMLQTRNTDQEVAEDEIELDYQGDDADIGFNITYFLDVLNALNTETIQVSFSGSNNSAIVEGVGNEQCLYVVMPMRI